jgi:hypothetical protein
LVFNANFSSISAIQNVLWCEQINFLKLYEKDQKKKKEKNIKPKQDNV